MLFNICYVLLTVWFYSINSTEADVNTATPSLSNAAATWAGWAVTTMTAKFYRSQSDTPKTSNPDGGRILLNKPASLGSF